MLQQCGLGRPPGVEAIHSALMAHPASILVELDDSQFPASAPLALSSEHQHHHQLGFNLIPELVLDEVARRLFVCLLAGLKTYASQVSLCFSLSLCLNITNPCRS